MARFTLSISGTVCSFLYSVNLVNLGVNVQIWCYGQFISSLFIEKENAAAVLKKKPQKTCYIRSK